jgi:putative heme transporter
MSDEDDRPDVEEPPPPATAATPSAREVSIEPGRTLAVVDGMSYVHLVLGLLGLLVIVALAGSAADSLTKVLIGTVLALALDTPVRRLQSRGLPRGAAAGLVCFVVLAGLGLVLGLLGPPAIREAARFPDELPATLAELYDFPVVGGRLEEADVAARSDEWLAELPGNVTADSVSEILGRVVAGVASVLQVLLLTLALLLDGEVLIRRVRSVLPAHLRGRADRAGRLVYDTLGRYFAGSLLLAGMSGTYILTVGLIIGVPLVVFAAIWVMITDLIPQVGGFLGGSVFVTLALTDGALTGVLALGLFMAYMSTENYLIQPAVVGKAVNLSPPTTMLAAIMGGTAAGLPGAIIATPFVGSVKALYLAARYGTDGEGDDDGSPGDGSGTPLQERAPAGG